jgi:hypothetical protein
VVAGRPPCRRGRVTARENERARERDDMRGRHVSVSERANGPDFAGPRARESVSALVGRAFAGPS